MDLTKGGVTFKDVEAPAEVERLKRAGYTEEVPAPIQSSDEAPAEAKSEGTAKPTKSARSAKQ